ncbi:hypothetical protein [Flavobacterium cerinum]|uniref:Uncharacterized protein n=1 Tax=Flavobacterium cerinum TaxID=2502784 RepID=A0A444GM85_9FLAO|nr:hypothetical protein [Flavobacterium cerinum]RWW91841.1 hypothetical protein EPI11_17520 [Flavobacterium cerinum]
MAYNKKNLYKKIIEIQELTKSCQSLGMTNVHIFNEYISNHYHISKRTFDEYLGIPAERELKKLVDAENSQTKLFADE